MAIPEQQLETWAKQGAVAGSRDTYATVKLALEANTTEYAGKKYEVFLQGSYGNDTNVYSESDVDVVILFKTAFHHDLTLMESPEQTAFHQAYNTTSTDSVAAFKAQVLTVLQKRFGNSVKAGPKAIKIPAENGRRNADVVVALDFRRYRRFVAHSTETYDEGICFFSDTGKMISNYPKKHSANCTTKHKGTSSRYKPTVRILKNLRQCLVDNKVIEKGIAPSYFLEGLLYNVPESCFGTTYQKTVLDSLRWVLSNDEKKFVCANYQHWLLGDDAVRWPAANYKKFLDETVKLWDNWK